jgi:hypothetical protein
MMLFSKKGWECGPSGRKLLSLPLVIASILVGLYGYSTAAAQDIFSVTEEGRITAHIADLPLEQALAELSRSVPLDIRGSVAKEERLTLDFSRLTLEGALREMMVGYNYVLITPKGQDKPVLVVLGKAENDEGIAPLLSYGPPPPSYERTAPVPSSPVAASTSIPVPPSPTTPLPSAGLARESEAAATEEHLRPDSNEEGPAGVGSNPDSGPPFNPAAWGGRGFKGSAASGRK